MLDDQKSVLVQDQRRSRKAPHRVERGDSKKKKKKKKNVRTNQQR